MFKVISSVDEFVLEDDSGNMCATFGVEEEGSVKTIVITWFLEDRVRDVLREIIPYVWGDRHIGG